MSEPLRPGRRTTAPRALSPAGSLLSGAMLVTLALALVGCAPGTSVTIVNASGDTLADARIVGERDSSRLAPLPPGVRVQRRIGVRGEDAIVLRGRIGERALTPMMAVYVEPGCRVRLVVDSTGAVRVLDEHALAY